MINFVMPVLKRYWILFGVISFWLLLAGCSDDNNETSQLPANSVPQDMITLAEDISSANDGRAAILHISTATGKSWSTAAGLADVSTNTAAKVGDLVEIGSVSKVFLAVTVLRLVEQDTLSLEDSLTKWFDKSLLDTLTNGNGEQLVLRHLLNHSWGIGDYLNFAEDNTVLEYYGIVGDTVYMPQDHIDFTVELTVNNPYSDAPEHKFPLFTPQDAFGLTYPDYDSIPFTGYSNTGYVMLAIIVESVTGERYEDIIREEVIIPLGLENTSFGTDGVRADLTGYALGLTVSGEEPVAMSPTLSWSAGQIISTPSDLAKFLSSVASGELFDQSDTLDLWMNMYFKNFGVGITYGLGIMKREIDGAGTVIGHNGQVFGAVALVFYELESGDVYAASVNNSQYVGVESDERSNIWELAEKLHAISAENR